LKNWILNIKLQEDETTTAANLVLRLSSSRDLSKTIEVVDSE